MATTYIELVNNVIDEGKISNDPLTPADFNDPPRTAMYIRVKRWVNEAYQELLITRNEWFSRKERGVTSLYPRLLLGDVSVPPVPGYVYRGRSSGIEFVVRTVSTHETIENSPTPYYTVGVERVDEEEDFYMLGINEVLDVITPAPTISAAKYKGHGYYSVSDFSQYAEVVDPNSISIVPTDEEYQEDNNWYQTQVRPILWKDLGDLRRGARLTGSIPPYVSVTPQGSLYFYPPFTFKRQAEFEFTRAFSLMQAHSDTPVGIPEKYVKWIVWRALMSYGDFQQNGAIWSRGDKNAEKIMNIMERDNAPQMTVARY